MTDPVSDLLTRLRNASRAGLAECDIPHSKLKAAICDILVREGYLGAVAESRDERGHRILRAQLKYSDGTPAITGIDRVSRPGRRLYTTTTEIPRVLNGLGMSILTTPKGVMKDADARRQRVGGEIICNVW